MIHEYVLWLLDVISLSATAFVVLFSSPPKNFFTIHPLLASTKWHWIVQSISIVLLYTAVAAVYLNKIQGGKPHFTTWHGCCGLLSVLFATTQILAGFWLDWSLWPIRRWLSFCKARLSHMYSAVCLLIMTSITAVLGLQSQWFELQLSRWVPDHAVSAVSSLLSAMVFSGLIRVWLQVKRVGVSPSLQSSPQNPSMGQSEEHERHDTRISVYYILPMLAVMLTLDFQPNYAIDFCCMSPLYFLFMFRYLIFHPIFFSGVTFNPFTFD
ncbi:unnamed protein product [Dicrocoelium dendriticum]|nr:unnamed protein product [Dicrocoelium dendriticum]